MYKKKKRVDNIVAQNKNWSNMIHHIWSQQIQFGLDVP